MPFLETICEKQPKTFESLIERVDKFNDEAVSSLGLKAKERMSKKYSWKEIVDGYGRVFHSIVRK